MYKDYLLIKYTYKKHPFQLCATLNALKNKLNTERICERFCGTNAENLYLLMLGMRSVSHIVMLHGALEVRCGNLLSK